MNIPERVYKRTHVPIERLIESPTFPDDMKIEVTSRCNYKCSFCATNKNLRRMGDMDFQIFKGIVEECWLLGVHEIGLFLLGEPFMKNDINEYIRYAKYAGIEYVYLTSNGSVCGREDIQKCVDAGLDSLKISLNAGTKESYIEVTGRNFFDHVMKMIEWISKQKFNMNFCVSCVWDNDYETELLEIEKVIRKLGVDFYFLSKYNHAGFVNADYCGNVGIKGSEVDSVPCWELFNTSRITWDGYMSCCSFAHTDDFRIGNIDDSSLLELWTSEKFINLRKAHLSGNVRNTICESCIYAKGN